METGVRRDVALIFKVFPVRESGRRMLDDIDWVEIGIGAFIALQIKYLIHFLVNA